MAFVSETILLPSHRIYLPGYNVIRSDRQVRKGGGVALVLHHLIAFDALSTTADSPFESVGARITLANSKIDINSIYNPHKNNLDPTLLKPLSTSGNFTLIAGDYNAKHPAWSSTTPNPIGNALIKFTNSRNFSLLAPSGPTFIPSISGQSPSTLDLILTNRPWCTHNLHTLPDTPSDHLPVLFWLSGTFSTIRPSPRLDLKNADWDLFKSSLDDSINSTSPLIFSPSDLDSQINSLTSLITSAASVAIPLSTPKPTFAHATPPTPWLLSSS